MDKPMMFMFDISRCAGLVNALEGCPTPSICVTDCPQFEWSFDEGGKNESVREFCRPMPDEEWEERTIEELITLRICPAYLVKQKPLFDRCLPSFVNGVPLVEMNDTSDLSLEHNMTSVHDGEQSEYFIKFLNTDDQSLDIISILGSVKKSLVSEIESNQTETVDRLKRNVEEGGSLEPDEYETIYTILEESNITSKRDLSDAINIQALKDGVDQLKEMLDLQSLSEKLIWDLSVYWWIMMLFFLLAFVLSFTWIGEKTGHRVDFTTFKLHINCRFAQLLCCCCYLGQYTWLHSLSLCCSFW